MHSTILLAQLALWTSTTHAFFPFTPKYLEEIDEKRALESRDGGVQKSGNGVTFGIKQRSSSASVPQAERAAREAARLTARYRQRTSNVASSAPSLDRRDNEYDIMEAEVSGDKLTEGIHQDGTDYSYFLQAQFGSKGKELYLLVDTGAGSSWVMGSNCNSEACSLHDSFGVEDSDTFKASSEVFSVEYGSGEVEGHLATDTIQLGGMSFDFQFGVAEKTSKDFVHFAFDGILGLSMNKGANENFLQTMEDSGDLDANVFGVSLHRASDGTNDGEIQFGSVNSDRYQGDITYTPLKAEGDDWAIKLDDITYDGKSANAQGVHAYIDTGTTFIFAPEAAAKAFHDLIPGAKSSDGMYYKVPCDSKAPLIFTF
jgi:hypothetical protein